MSDFEAHVQDLWQRATNPQAIVVAPDSIADPQAFADATGITLMVASPCPPTYAYMVAADEKPLWEPTLVVEPQSAGPGERIRP